MTAHRWGTQSRIAGLLDGILLACCSFFCSVNIERTAAEQIMRAILRHRTGIGAFYIAQAANGTFHPIFDQVSLGSYRRITHAIDDLVNDATDSVLHPDTFELVDTSVLGLPDDPAEWERL